ncbi:unnamed protein product [Mytilus coruscus]|uniref:Endonuclease/exonuclease/phosphatase domain-containing protein n=1 Tax=Mytilus coruscus TaxID=42192 RepID=A0A6J8CW93_MYTCO|nr:unnamed protein product [Mytilus coruscus]
MSNKDMSNKDMSNKDMSNLGDPYRKDRNSSGGGIIIYICKFIQAKPRPDLDFDNEALWLEINFPSQKLLLCVVYRQPSNNNTFWDKFHESIENALSYSPNFVITGDVNVDFLTHYSHKIFDIMRLNGLKNIINEPTRFCATRQSLLDPILVSDSCDVYDSHVIQIDRTSSDRDETIIFLNNLTRSKNSTTYKRMICDYRNADFDKCIELIATFDWESRINAENSMDQNCKNFTNKFLEYINDCIPQKEVTLRPNDKIWFNSDLRREIRKRDRLHKQARRSNGIPDLNKYKKQRNHVNILKRYTKDQFYLNANSLLDEFACGNCKSYWSVMKKLVKTSGNSTHITQLKNEDNE